jgi:hypothetical protein
MVENSLSGSGEGPGWATAPGYSTAGSVLPIRKELVNPTGNLAIPAGLPAAWRRLSKLYGPMAAGSWPWAV